VTKDPKQVEEEKWKAIHDDLENAEEESECLIIGEGSHNHSNINNITPTKERPMSGRKSSMGNTNYGAGNTNRFTEMSAGFALGPP
jgi:hypothetical protein